MSTAPEMHIINSQQYKSEMNEIMNLYNQEYNTSKYSCESDLKNLMLMYQFHVSRCGLDTAKAHALTMEYQTNRKAIVQRYDEIYQNLEKKYQNLYNTKDKEIKQRFRMRQEELASKQRAMAILAETAQINCQPIEEEGEEEEEQQQSGGAGGSLETPETPAAQEPPPTIQSKVDRHEPQIKSDLQKTLEKPPLRRSLRLRLKRERA